MVSKHEYNNYLQFIKKKNLIIGFQSFFGFGFSKKKKFELYKILGIFKNKSIKLIKLLRYQENILKFLFTIFFSKKTGTSFFNYFMQLKKNAFSFGSYKYIQNSHNLPVNGQRTRTNAKTCKNKFKKNKISKVKKKIKNAI